MEAKDLSSERRVAKERLLTENNVIGRKKGSGDFVCKKGWLPDALYPLFLKVP